MSSPEYLPSFLGHGTCIDRSKHVFVHPIENSIKSLGILQCFLIFFLGPLFFRLQGECCGRFFSFFVHRWSPSFNYTLPCLVVYGSKKSSHACLPVIIICV